jgi:hypothetical protein
MVQTLAKKMKSVRNHTRNLADMVENKGANPLNECNSEISHILTEETHSFSHSHNNTGGGN